MGSDKTRAILGFAKLALALVVGYAIAWVWAENRVGLDEWYVPYAAGAVAAVMVFILLSKLNKGSGD
jgi:predicted Co/Zn/Cd cation transporter (cation efflux family)